MRNYDFFISHSTKDVVAANELVKKLESKNYKCFIAPRDIDSGAFFAEEIIDAIDNSKIILLLYSKHSMASTMVLNEITAAVSRSKIVIQIRLEDIALSKALEFFIGSMQWLDSYNQISDKCIDEICAKFVDSKDEIEKTEQEAKESREARENEDFDIVALTNKEALKRGYTKNELLMKDIEIDFLCIPKEKFIIDDEIEGTFDDWKRVFFIAEDISCYLFSGNDIVGYGEVYPVKDSCYQELIKGEKIIDLDMLDTYVFGGDFNIYIGMFGVIPSFDFQTSYIPIFDWFVKKITSWKNDNINVKNIGISVYSDVLEEILKKFGFKYVGLNPAKGKIYETTYENFINNELISKRYKGILE